MVKLNFRKRLGIRIKSSSIVEVITALIIISMVTTIAMMIYLNVQQSGFSLSRLSHKALLDEAYENLKKEKNYVSAEFELDGVQITQTVEHSNLGEGLVLILLESRDSKGKIIEQRKHLLYDPSFQK